MTTRRACVALMATALLASPSAHAQAASSPAGLWRTIDDKTGRENGLVRIYKTGGAFYGNVERINDPERAKLTCTKCTDDRKDKPLVGLNIIRGLKPDGDGWSGGTVVDPETGSIYRASMKLIDGGQKLSLRGYIGISLLGRSQVWLRAK